MNLGDILDAERCKKAYKRATLKVHPDKTVNMPPEKRFVATRVFDALSQAMADANL